MAFLVSQPKSYRNPVGCAGESIRAKQGSYCILRLCKEEWTEFSISESSRNAYKCVQSCELLKQNDLKDMNEFCSPTSEFEYILSTHSWGARSSSSQLTTTPIMWPFLSITTSPTRRNTNGGRGLRTALEAAGAKGVQVFKASTEREINHREDNGIRAPCLSLLDNIQISC